MTDRINPQQFHESAGVADWRVLGDGACVYFRTRSFAASARLVQAIGALPGIDDHPPDVDVRPDGVTVRLLTTAADYYGMSQRDVALARDISAAACKLGLAADPAAVQSFLVIPGAPATAAILPFWRAVLGYEPRPDSPDEDLIDPRNRVPAFWFEQMEQPLPDGGGARSMSRSGCRTNRRKRASRRRSRQVAGWCATNSRRPGGHWPTRQATRPTSPPHGAAPEQLSTTRY